MFWRPCDFPSLLLLLPACLKDIESRENFRMIASIIPRLSCCRTSITESRPPVPMIHIRRQRRAPILMLNHLYIQVAEMCIFLMADIHHSAFDESIISCSVISCVNMFAARKQFLSMDYWWPSLSIGLAVLCFYSKTGFWPSYCQISTDLDKILHTPIVLWSILEGRLRPRSAHGRLQAKPKRLCFFVILVTHPKSYRDDGSPRFWRQTVEVEVRTGAIVKNSKIL